MKRINFIQDLFPKSFACATIFAFFATLASSALLTGCAGFTEDGNASSADIIEDYAGQFAAARVMQTGSYFENATKDSITLIIETVGGCIKNDNSYMWNADFYYADSVKFAYRFSGDSLLLTRPILVSSTEKGDSILDATTFLIGGIPGKFDGIWKILPCRWYAAERRTACDNDAYDVFVQINNGKVEYRMADRSDFDYMNSIFVFELFMFLDNQNSIQLETPFYGTRMTELSREKYGITVQEKTNKSMKFTYRDHLFDLNLKYARSIDSVYVTLSSGNTTCVGYSREMSNVLPEMCREENAEYLYKRELGGMRYNNENHIEFENCINGILGRERNDL